MSNYIYIGKFFHRKGKEFNLLEKKVGITNDLAVREYELNRTKSPIGYTVIAAWDAGDDARKIERQIHALLDHDQSYGEWFEDDDDDLIARVSKFMGIEGCQEVSLGKDEDSDANNVRKTEKEKSEMATLREQYVACLRDIPFHSHLYGVKITVTMRGIGEFFCDQTQKEYPTLNSAFSNSGKELTGRERFAIHAWAVPRDDNGNTPDDIIKKAAAAAQE
ncbi:MAG: GIY-YIG nuclease family protein [bacterium]